MRTSRLYLPCLLSLLLPLASYAQSPSLSKPSLSSAEPNVLLALPARGRVSIQAQSATGAAISLQDRMLGELARDGEAGKRDGRIDLSLDEGEYRLRLESRLPQGAVAALDVRAFSEAGGASPAAWPTLVPGRSYASSLKDLEQGSFWLRLREDGPLEVEALGRDLALVEVWREGQYLVGSYPVRELRQLEASRPQGYACASLSAKAGLYLVRAYGGPARAWAKDDGRHPLLLRSGFLSLPIGGRLELKLSPFGRDFIRVDGAELAVLAASSPRDARLRSGPYAPGRDRLSASESASMSKKGKESSLIVSLPSGPGLVAVEGQPGEEFSLAAFIPASGTSTIPAASLRSGGLLTVVAPPAFGPELEPSGIAYRVVAEGSRRSLVVVKDFCPPLSSSNPLRRSCNLVSDEGRSLLVRVEEEGDYAVVEKSGLGQAEAFYSLRRFGVSGPEGGGSANPAPRSRFSLVRGYYLLSISAKSLGSLDFALFKTGFGKTGRDELAKEPPAARKNRSIAFAPDAKAGDLSLFLAQGPAAGSGFGFAPYPLALDRGLGLELGPQESLELGSTLSSPSICRGAQGPSASLDGAALTDGRLLAQGPHSLALRNSSQAPATAAFGFEPSYGDLPAASASAFGSGLTMLAPGRASYRDFARGERSLYAFEAKESGVYVIETLGRLATSLRLRSASRTELLSAQSNGYGRNAAIRAWLRPGRYYVEAQTLGSSAGRCGMRMDRVALAQGSTLASGGVDRRALPADNAAVFDFKLASASLIELASIGLGGAFQVRLEDEEGFIAYSGSGQARLRLGAGAYRLYSLPQSIETKRLSWFRILPSAEGAAAQAGGPRRLELNRSSSATWNESESPDRYAFSLPAALELSFSLPEAFTALLEGPGGRRELGAAERASLSLAAGDYLLSLRPKDRANQLDYSVSLSTAVLAPGVDGIAVEGSSPTQVEVSVPADGFYELWSLGRSDVAATLVAKGGAIVASSDDNGPDWNFDIVQRLKAGRYLLKVGALASDGSSVELHMTARAARSLPSVQAPYAGEAALDEAGILLPIEARGGDGLFRIEAGGEAAASLRLYKGDTLLAKAEGSLVLPLREGERYSLYAWSSLAERASISVRRLADKSASLASGFSIGPGEAVRLDNSQSLSARLSSGGLLVSASLERPCLDPGLSPFSVSKEGGWALALESGASVVPLSLREGEGSVLELGPTEQGFSASSPDMAILVSADTRGQFRCGISAAPSKAASAAPYDWKASASWSQGSQALLAPGDWKLRIWDGQAAEGQSRRVGVGLRCLPLSSSAALVAGEKRTVAVPAGSALSFELPACTLSALIGEGLVLSAWKGDEALASVSAQDGRRVASLGLKGGRLLVANTGSAEASLRLALLPLQSAGLEAIDSGKAFESVGLPPEGKRLLVSAGPGELLCLAGDDFEAELQASDGSFRSVRREASTGLYSSFPASSGTLVLSSAKGLARAYIARPGKELEGLLERRQGAPSRELKDVAALSPSGDSFKIRLDAPGYADISCPGPGLLSLSGSAIETRSVVSGSREDIHLFAYLPAGEYSLWQRPARGAQAGGALRLDKVAARPAAEAGPDAPAAFIGAGEYQAWSFSATGEDLVGVGIRADKDGLEGSLYDARQGLLGKGGLIFARLSAGEYLYVVKGLPAEPLEYRIALYGAEGSRLGVPPEVIEGYKSDSGKPSSVVVPMKARRSGSSAPAYSEEEPQAEQMEGDSPDGDSPEGEGEYYEGEGEE